MLRNIPEGLFQFNLDKIKLLDGLVPFIRYPFEKRNKVLNLKKCVLRN
jgi:hypothetical protein